MTRARHRADTRRATRLAITLAAAVLLASGASGWAAAARQIAPLPSTSAPASETSSFTGATARDQDPVQAVPATPPAGISVASVSIPSIGVNAPTEQLTRDSSGALQPPTSFSDTGWYRDGVLPGRIGPAVIAGHIDSADGPAVFAGLRLLRPGAAVQVTLSNGSTVDFTVDSTMQVSKGAFPTDRVYGPTLDPQLRIITCAGTFDPVVGHYDDNIVVFASLAS